MDLDHIIGNDLAIAVDGDLQNVTNPEEGQQRVLRRLLTNPGDYFWHPDYGAGLARYIGQPEVKGQIIGTIRKQMRLEQAVVQNPPPNITVNLNVNGEVVASIQYVDADSKLTSKLTMPITG